MQIFGKVGICSRATSLGEIKTAMVRENGMEKWYPLPADKVGLESIVSFLSVSEQRSATKCILMHSSSETTAFLQLRIETRVQKKTVKN